MKNMLLGLALLVAVPYQLYSQKVDCSDKLSVNYVKSDPHKKRAEITGIKDNQISIAFYSGFTGDSVTLYQNNKLIKKLYLKTNKMISYTGQSLVLNKKRKYDLLKIQLIGTKNCFEIPVQDKFKALQIHLNKEDTTWYLNYSNYVIELE